MAIQCLNRAYVHRACIEVNRTQGQKWLAQVQKNRLHNTQPYVLIQKQRNLDLVAGAPKQLARRYHQLKSRYRAVPIYLSQIGSMST